MLQRRVFLGTGAAGLAASLGLPAWAQKYPDGPVTIVLPLQAGSASDVAVRQLAERLGARLGAGFAVENVAAAAGLVGLERLARARPDGRTVAALNNSIMTILPHLQARNMKSEPRRDFVPVGGIANIPTFFAVPANSPFKDVQDLVRAAKAGERITYASGGVGSPQHLATEMFNAYAGVKLVHVPYRGASQATLATASGEVQLMSMALSLAQPFLQDKRVRLIGFCGTERHPQHRDIPTLQEQGVRNYDYSSWIALFLHREAPAEAIETLRRETQAITADADFQAQLARAGLDPWPRGHSELTRIIDEDFVRWQRIIQEANIQAT